MSHIFNLKKQEPDERDYTLAVQEATNTAKSIDLRLAMPAVFDQGTLGSCSANSSTAYTMFLHDKLLLLSRLYEYYMVRTIEGTVKEDSGATNRDNVKSIKNSGICEESFMAYLIDLFAIAPTEEANINAKLHTISSYAAVTNLTQLKLALTIGKPVIIGMDVYDSFESDAVANNGKMPMPKRGECNLGGHSVLAVGYKDTPITLHSEFQSLITRTSASKGYVICRNSWGDTWGDKGYFYMPYEYFDKYTFDYWVMNK